MIYVLDLNNMKIGRSKIKRPKTGSMDIVVMDCDKVYKSLLLNGSMKKHVNGYIATDLLETMMMYYQRK